MHSKTTGAKFLDSDLACAAFSISRTGIAPRGRGCIAPLLGEISLAYAAIEGLTLTPHAGQAHRRQIH